MKKFFFVVVLCLLCSTVLSACTVAATEHEILSDALNIDVSTGEIKSFTDTHGGFLGDGTTYAELVFPDDSFYTTIQNNSKWVSLPLSQELQVVVYGGTRQNGESWQPFVRDENGNPLIPTIFNGYFFFKDRQAGIGKEQDDSMLFQRYSMNFILAIYDADTQTLYYYKYDS